MGITREEAFEVLELPFGADQDAVRTSYKRLALKWHPDKHENSAQSTQKFQRISKAYKRLTDDTEDEEVTMSMSDMFDLFQQIFFAKAMGAFNGYGGYPYDDSYDEDDDYDDEDDDEVDYLSIIADKIRTKQDYRKSKNDNLGTTNRYLTPEEIERNAHELITEEEKEKRKAEKRRAKKKRRREKKKLEKQESEQQKKDNSQKNSPKQKAESAVENENLKSSKKDKKSKDSSQSEEEDFDQTAAFFTKVISKKKKGTPAIPESQPSNKNSKTKEKSQKQNQSLPQQQQVHQQNGKMDEENEDLDPVVLRSRQLAIRGNEMANSGHYNPAIELFTEAIKLDPSDFRFFGNRSYCFDRNQQYEKALRDAEKAISLSPEWPKGYFRKGRALAGLNLYAEAEQAFMQVLKLDRQCEDAMQELLRVRSQQLIEMGFSRQQAESATRQYGTVQQALDSLLSGGVAENSLGSEVYISDDEDSNRSVNINHKILQNPPHPAPTLPLRTAVGSATVKMDPKNPEGLTALWVGNVLPEVTDKMLMQMFSKYGTVTSVRLLPEKFCAFVNYKNKEGAGKAMAVLQGVECCGQRLLIKFPDNPISNGNVVIRKQNTVPVPATDNQIKTQKVTYPTAASLSSVTMITNGSLDKQSGPVNGDECYFWRTTGCLYGDKCRWKHQPDHKGIDRKPWQKVK